MDFVEHVVGCTVTGGSAHKLRNEAAWRDAAISIRAARAAAGYAGAKKFLILSVFFMAISFFAFMTLVETADLSFAVPASAATHRVRNNSGALDFKEQVDSRRWWGVCLVALGVILAGRVIILRD